MNRYVRGNRELWEAWTDVNVRSAFYDVAGFKAAPLPLDAIVRAGLGDVSGKSVLHLQCHFGLDTLRVALAGGHATGVDFSPKAISHARALAEELGIAARFIESDLYALPDAPELAGATFDLVFTSWGVLSWLPDLAPWGRIIARFLRPGGTFFIAEGHPTLLLFESHDKQTLALHYPYFATPDPIVIPVTGNYADPTAQVSVTEYAFPHSLEDIIMSLLDAGLRLDELREHQHIPWQAFPFMVERAPHEWAMPPDRPSLPLAFSLRASKGTV